MKPESEDATVDRPSRLLKSIDAIPATEFLECARRGLCCWRGAGLDSTSEELGEGILTTHADRKPRKMPLEMSQACDTGFDAQVGWRARSNHSLFVSGSRQQAAQFGTPVIVIPVAPAGYVWSPRIADLTQHLEALGVTSPAAIPDLLESGDYRNGDLEAAIVSGNEIMVRCERYYWSAVTII